MASGNSTEHQTTAPKRNLRGIPRIRWSVEEKEKILFWHAYSRADHWGAEKKRIFWEKISEAELPPEKMATTSINKLSSLVSQVHTCMTSQRIEQIKTDAARLADEHARNIGEEDNVAIKKKTWTQQEKWSIFWLTEYSKQSFQNRREIAQYKRNIINIYCPYKLETSNSNINSMVAYMKKNNTYNEEQVDQLKCAISEMIENDYDPHNYEISINPIAVTHRIQAATPAELQATTPPIQQATTPPIQQATTPPIQQATTPPVQQATIPPVQQATTPPVQQATTPPVEQATTPPVQQARTPPVHHARTPLVHHASTPPVQQARTPPIQQVITPPVQQATAPPVQQATTPPVQQATIPPVQQARTPPIQQATTTPVQQVITPPVQQATTLPVQQATTPPIQQATTPPVQQATTPPVQQATTPPIQQARTPPVQQATTPPIQQARTPPVQQVITLPLRHITPQSIEQEFSDIFDRDEIDNILDEFVNIIEKVENQPIDKRQKIENIYLNKTAKNTVKLLNKSVKSLLPHDATLTQINQYNYAVSLYIVTKFKTGDINKNNLNKNKFKKLPPWRKRMEDDLKQKRKECGQINEYLRGITSRRLDHIVSNIKRKYNIQRNTELEQKKVELGLQITALAKRIKNADEKYERKKQNHKFETNQKLFYREIREEKINVERIPSKTEVEEFWRNLYENEMKYKVEPDWLGSVTETMNEKPSMNDITITIEDFSAKVSKFSNHKSAGIDKVTNFWIKQLTELHPYYIKSLNRILNQTEEMSKWFNTGSTTLLPKTADTHLPQKYRPICCLPTIYKTLTGIIADQIYNHLIDNSMLEKQQKGCIRKTLGAKDQLLINKAITENSKKRQTNLSMA